MEKVEEMDEVVMAEIQKSQGEYKPLAKVEELEERKKKEKTKHT